MAQEGARKPAQETDWSRDADWLGELDVGEQAKLKKAEHNQPAIRPHKKRGGRDWTEADELYLGEDLQKDILGHIARGEEVPQELVDAMKVWEAGANILAYSNDPERSRVWHDAIRGFRLNMERQAAWLNEKRELIDRSFDPKTGTIVDPRMSMERELPGAMKLTDPAPDTWKLPDLPRSMSQEIFAIHPEAMRRASIVGNPVEIHEGRSLVKDAYGQVWDLTEARESLSRPEVRQRIRHSMMGLLPSDLGLVAHTAGAMPTAHMYVDAMRTLAENSPDIVSKGINPDNMLRRNMVTAIPGLVLPWELGLNQVGLDVGDEADLWKDPVWARALLEVVSETDTEATGLESFAHATAGLADFLLFSKGMNAGLRGVGALTTKMSKGGTLMQMAGNTLTKIGKVPTVFPVNTNLVRTVSSFVNYELFTKSLDDSSTISQNFWHGLQQGVLFTVAGKAGQIAGKQLTNLAAKTPLGKIFEQVAPRIFEVGARGGGDASRSLELIRKFTERTFSKTLEKVELAPHAKQALRDMLHSYWTGVFVHSFGAAQQAPEGERFNTFWSGLFSAQSMGTGLGFALNGALQYGLLRPKLLKTMRSPEGVEYMKEMARALARPTSDVELNKLSQQMRRWREKEPEIFDGIVLENPAAQEARVRSKAEELLIQRRLEAGDETGLLDLYGVFPRRRKPQGGAPYTREVWEPPVANALEGFKALTQRAELELVEGARPVRERHLTGEVPADRWRELGFESKSEGGVFRRVLNAVHEYLRDIEQNEETKYRYVKEVPEALMRRVLDWRDKGKPSQLDLNFNRMGNEGSTDARAPGPRQGTLAEAQMILGKVRGEASYGGLANTEKVSYARGKMAKPREDRKRALKLYQSGYRSIEWLKNTYPEGASAVGKPRDSSWISKWFDQIDTAWTLRAKDKGRRRHREKVEELIKDGTIGGKPAPFGAYLRARGGLDLRRSMEHGKISKDNIDRLKELDKRPEDAKHRFLGKLVREGSGIPIEEAKMDAAARGWLGKEVQELYEQLKRDPRYEDADVGEGRSRFFEREAAEEMRAEHALGITNEAFIEAIFTGRFRNTQKIELEAERALERQVEEGVRDLERQHGDQLREWRECIESGELELPEDPQRRQDWLMEAYAGDPRFGHMKPDMLERAVLELRAQAEAGDPGTVMAGPIESSVETARRAGVVTEELVEMLKAYELLDYPHPVRSPEAMLAIDNLLRGKRPADVEVSAWELMRDMAREARDATQEAIRKDLAGTWNEKELAGMEDVWSFLRARDEGLEVPKNVLERMKERGHLEESGEIKSAVIEHMQRAGEQILDGLQFGGGEGFSSFASPLAFERYKFTDVDGVRNNVVSWQFIMDKPRVQELLGNNPWLRAVFKTLTGIFGNPVVPLLNLGPISRPQSTAQRRRMEEFLLRMGVDRGKQEEAMMAIQFAASRLADVWQGQRPPKGDLEFFWRGMQKDGLFASARGPKDLEAMREGSGYMWPIYTRARDILEALGQDMVKLGLMTQGQLDQLGGGRYLAHYYIKEQLETDAGDISNGRIPIRGQGRSMSREDGTLDPTKPVIPIRDPMYALVRGVMEESRSIRFYSMLRRVMEKDSHWALSPLELQAQMAYDRRDFQPTAIRVEPLEGETMHQAVTRMVNAGHPKEAVLMGARLGEALRQMAPEGKEPTEGQTPYTKEKETILKWWLGEGPGGERFIPKPMAAEMEILASEIFTIPGESASARFSAMVDQGLTFTKRGLTVMRPYAWALQMLGNIERNAALGGVPRHDFIAGVAGHQGSFTGKGIKGASLYLRWLGEGLPGKRPENWSHAEWSALAGARDFMRAAGIATSAFHTLGPELANALGRGFSDPLVTRAAWKNDLDELARKGGWTVGQQERLAKTIEQMTNRMFRGLELLDSKILRQLGEADPVQKAKALGTFTSAWNIVDVFLFKYPAFLKARHEWPNLPISRVIQYALGRTSNVGDTHPALRRYLSMTSPYGDSLWMAAQGTTKIGGFSKGKLKLALAQLLKARFWTDPATSEPVMWKASVTHPLRMATSLAMGSGITALIMAAMDEESVRLHEEEGATARQVITRWPALSDKSEEAVRKVGTKVGNLGGHGFEFPNWMISGMAKWWRQTRQLNPMAVPMPSHGGQSRFGSFLAVSPPGQLIERVRGLQKLTNVGGLGESTQARDDFLRGVEQIFGLKAQVGLGLAMGWLTGNSELIDAMGGRGTLGEVAAKALFSVTGSAGVFFPTLGLTTREGRFMGEAVFNEGQRWEHAAQGIITGYKWDPVQQKLVKSPHESPAEAALGVGLNYLWPGRSMIQRKALGGPVDGYTAILGELYKGFRPSTAEGRGKMRAHAWVARQMSQLFADTYAQFIEDQGEPGKADFTLDQRIFGAIRETLMNTQPDERGHWRIRPGYEPKTALLLGLANLSDERAHPEEKSERAHAIEHLVTYVTASNFKEDGRAALLEIGRRAQMPTGVFREAMRNAIEDPRGTNLLKWWWSQVKDEDPERMGQLAPLFWDVAMPAEGSEAMRDYQALRRLYTRYNYKWPPAPASASAEEVLGSEKSSRAIQGGRALSRSARSRPAVQKPGPKDISELFVPE